MIEVADVFRRFAAVWRKPWIAHVTAWRRGEQAVLDYLARYVFRIAITNARIVDLDDAGVTIEYRHRKTGRRRTCRPSGEEVMRRFLQHVLARGFHKVRDFGLWHPVHRQDAARVRQMLQMLQLQGPPPAGPPEDRTVPPPDPTEVATAPPVEPQICPHCHQGRLICVRRLERGHAMGP